MTVEERPKEAGLPEDTSISLSQFAARVLSQLSLSAWLPAAFFVISLAVLLTFNAQGSMDLILLVETLQDSRVQWTLVLTAVPGLVVTTMVTQAFSFEAIRALEGYWSGGGVVTAFRTWMIKRQLKRRNRIHDRRLALGLEAFLSARPRWRSVPKRPSAEVMEALEIYASEGDESAISEETKKDLAGRDWWAFSDPWKVAEIDQLRAEESEFPPQESRVLPTRLGNLIRAGEDGLDNAGHDLEGFALRMRSLAPLNVQSQHDQFRTRLDMYCTLVFCAASLAVLAPVVLARVSEPWWATAAVTAGFIILARASYIAAIASARGYVVALKEMDAYA